MPKTAPISPSEMKIALESTDVVPMKKRLVELRLLGYPLTVCHQMLRKEGYVVSQDGVSRMWADTDINFMVDEIIRRQLSDIQEITETIIKKKEYNGEYITLKDRLTAYKLILQYRDRLFTTLMGRAVNRRGSNTQVNVIVPTPDPIPIIRAKSSPE